MNLVNNMTTNNNKMKITFVGLLFMTFVILWNCYNGAAALEVHYIGCSILFACAFVSLFMGTGNTTLSIYPGCRGLIFVALYYLASLTWATDFNNARIYIFPLLVFVLLTVVMTNYFVRLGDIRLIHFTIAIMGIVMAIVIVTNEGGFAAFYQNATKSAELGRGITRVGSKLLNANTIGLTSGYSAIVMFFYAFCYKKIYCYALMIVPIMVLMASASRKAILILAIGIFLVVYFKMKDEKNIQKYLKYIFGVLFVLVILSFVMSLDIMYTTSKRMSEFLNFFGDDINAKVDTSTLTRWKMIENGWKQFLYKPFFGIGMGNTRILYKVKLNFETYAHNDYIEHLVNGGIVGFLLYYSVIFKLIKDHIHLMKIDKDPSLIISLVFIILLLIMNFAMVSYYSDLTTYMFFILWISQVELKRKQLENQS